MTNKLFEVLYEDAELLVVNKPAGLVCHPTKTGEYSSLISRARLYLGKESRRISAIGWIAGPVASRYSPNLTKPRSRCAHSGRGAGSKKIIWPSSVATGANPSGPMTC